MQLKYETGTTPQYNGNIAGQLWGTPGSRRQRIIITSPLIIRRWTIRCCTSIPWGWILSGPLILEIKGKRMRTPCNETILQRRFQEVPCQYIDDFFEMTRQRYEQGSVIKITEESYRARDLKNHNGQLAHEWFVYLWSGTLLNILPGTVLCIINTIQRIQNQGKHTGR